MSGVPITGLIEPLNGGSFPVFEDINGFGGWRAVADVTARNAIPANFRKQGMVVVTQSDGQGYELVGGILDANWTAIPNISVSPFLKDYYVDTTFTGVSSGSASNPFKTIAAAIAAAPSTGAVIHLPIASTTIENVTFPATGDWQLTCPRRSANLTGTIAMANTGGNGRYTITNVQISSTITGSTDNTGNAQLNLEGCVVTGAISLTAPTGQWLVILRGAGQANANSLNGACNAITVGGSISASDWVFSGAMSFSVTGSNFTNCRINTNSITGTATAIGVVFIGCHNAAGALTITGPGAGMLVSADGQSTSEFFRVGLTLVSATLKTVNANLGATATVAGNVSPTNIITVCPVGLFEAVATNDLLAAGTAGTAVINIIYTNLNNVVTTLALTAGLLITAAVGTEDKGATQFSPKAGTAVQFSITGIVTPGALSMLYRVAVRRVD